jgi:hypothetical protein
VDRRIATLFLSASISVPMLLTGCGSSTNAPAPAPQTAPPMAAKADLIITVDGAQHACLVALKSESQGNSIPCADLIAFLRDELRVPNGAVYDLRTNSADKAEMAKLRANLSDAGYRGVDGQT